MVDLQRDMAGTSAIRLFSDDPFRVGNRDSAVALLDVDDEHDHQESDDGKDECVEIADRPRLQITVDRAEILRQCCDDTGKDDERYAVSDAVRRDLLADPHEEYRASRQGDRDDQNRDGIGIQDRLLQTDRHADSLEKGERYGQVACDLRRFLVPFLPFFGPLLQSRNDNREKLHDDRRVDVRRDAHRKDGKLAECTAGKEIQQAEQVARGKQLLNGRRIDARHRDVRTEPEHGEHDEREDDLLS